MTYFKTAQHVTKHYDYFSNKNCHRDLSKKPNLATLIQSVQRQCFVAVIILHILGWQSGMGMSNYPPFFPPPL